MNAPRLQSQRRRKAQRYRLRALQRRRGGRGSPRRAARPMALLETAFMLALPTRRDWREHLTITAGDQGSCQSCSAFAIAAAVRLRSEIGRRPVALEPGYLHTCIGMPGTRDRGTICATPNDPGVLLERLRDRGWRTGANDDHPYPASACQVGGTRNQLSDVRKIYSEAEAKQALADGPLVAEMRMPPEFPNFRGKVFRVAAGFDRPLHTVCVIGHDATGWIILNSMGGGWGDGSGFTTIPYGLCGLLVFRRGIATLGAYAPML